PLTTTPDIYPLSLHDALPISKFAAEGQLRALRRAALGVAVHRAAGHQPALLALSHPPRRPPHQPFPAHRPRPDPYRAGARRERADRKSTRLNSSHLVISYAVF